MTGEGHRTPVSRLDLAGQSGICLPSPSWCIAAIGALCRPAASGCSG